MTRGFQCLLGVSSLGSIELLITSPICALRRTESKAPRVCKMSCASGLGVANGDELVIRSRVAATSMPNG